jgi:hypothetical protein
MIARRVAKKVAKRAVLTTVPKVVQAMERRALKVLVMHLRTVLHGPMRELLAAAMRRQCLRLSQVWKQLQQMRHPMPRLLRRMPVRRSRHVPAVHHEPARRRLM